MELEKKIVRKRSVYRIKFPVTSEPSTSFAENCFGNFGKPHTERNQSLAPRKPFVVQRTDGKLSERLFDLADRLMSQ